MMISMNKLDNLLKVDYNKKTRRIASSYSKSLY